MTEACDACLGRTWLLERLAGHLEVVRARIDALLALTDGELVAAVAGGEGAVVQRELAAFAAEPARTRAAAAGLQLVCRCQPRYPPALRALPAPPAVLHVAGGMERFLTRCAEGPVAVVGSRSASAYGLEVARSLARGVSASGLTVVSGMARGIDAAAHAGALEASGGTVAVLAGSAHRPYPASKRRLYAAIVSGGAVISELGPTAAVWRWCFPARNRVIAALSALTIVVEAGARSGALLTAEVAQRIGRPIGAVPGRVTSPQAAGPNELLVGGAAVIRAPQDVLDRLYGTGTRAAVADGRPPVTAAERRLLDALADAPDTQSALVRARIPAEQALATLAGLELAGWVRRGAGGRFSVIP